MLDLACGTGTLAIAMTSRGWRTWGIDASERMIRAARRNAERSRQQVAFSRQDMRSFRLPERVDLVTSLFDSLNHLTTRRDLQKTFRSVRDVLRPEGYFIFDVNNIICYRTLWTRTESVHHADFTMILQNSFRPAQRSASSLVTIFLRKGDRFVRETEAVRERLYERGELEDALREAGLTVLRVEDFNFTGVPALGKIKTWFVARAM
jgi:SAM-dependent methyltransferase